MRIGIFTPRSLNPLHPRLVRFETYFISRGYSVTFVNESIAGKSRINWLYLWFIDLHAIRRCIPQLDSFDLVIVTDLKYLFLLEHAHRRGKKTYYDCIDHNVELRFYQLSSRFKFFKLLKWMIIPYFRRLERGYVFKYARRAIVNSDSLAEYFGEKAVKLFYTSPFEGMIQLKTDLPPAVLYLGAFTADKGAADLISLTISLNVSLYVFGDINEVSIERLLRSTTNVTHVSKLSVNDLRGRIEELMKTHFLFGASLIKPAHFSYEVQEANKDIDYLAMGIPIIGNDRGPTKDKILAGCGIFVNKLDGQQLHDISLREPMSKACVAYYRSKYSSENFRATLDKIIDDASE